MRKNPIKSNVIKKKMELSNLPPIRNRKLDPMSLEDLMKEKQKLATEMEKIKEKQQKQQKQQEKQEVKEEVTNIKKDEEDIYGRKKKDF